jgi:hypothetical protein
MKKSLLVILVSGIVLLSLAIWFFGFGFAGQTATTIQFAIVFLLVILGLYIGFVRLKSRQRGEPAEDELSKRMLQKASSLAFYISLYIWLVMLYLSEGHGFAGHTLIAGGIVAMAVTFAGSWVSLKLRGPRDE